ncbi:MAG: ABC transporter permease [Chloroflexi bacterium]|nr:ABC transporter permease [Chloroflexota bacterium]
MALSIAAIASVVVLITVFEGFKSGLSAQVRSYVDSLTAPLVVIQAGADSTAAVRSAVPAELVQKLTAAPEVQAVHPVLIVRSIFEHADHKTPVSVVGYEERGGPARIVAGRPVAGPDEAVFDRGLMRKHGLSLGDQVAVFGRRFKVVGVSSGTSSLLGSYIFVSLETLQTIASGFPETTGQATEAPTMLLVDLAPGVTASEAQIRLGALSADVRVVTPDFLAGNDVRAVNDIMGSAMTFLVYAAYVVGLLVVGLTFYGGVLERHSEFGIVKALGAGNRWLYAYVLAYSAALTAAALAIGIAASQGVASLIPEIAPQYLVVAWDPRVIFRTSVAALGIALIASAFPILRVSRVDPAMVFRR